MTHVALLRGINVGGTHRVPMPELRACLESLGMSEVTTYINSGNALFTAPARQGPANLRARIEQGLAGSFGFPVPTLVMPADDLVRIAAAIPDDWTNDDTFKSDVLFLFPELQGPDALDRFPIRAGIDEARYESGAVLWRVSRADQPRSGLISIVGTPLYRQCTIRNVNTVRTLAAKALARA